MYDDEVLAAFLAGQNRLYPEPVATSPEEAEEYLEDICAAVAESRDEVQEYLEDVGVDCEGLSEDEIFELPEIIDIGDGRFLILEI